MNGQNSTKFIKRYLCQDLRWDCKVSFFLQICNRVTTLVDVRILSNHGLAALDKLKKIFNLLENYLKILACSQVSDRCALGYLFFIRLTLTVQLFGDICIFIVKLCFLNRKLKKTCN